MSKRRIAFLGLIIVAATIGWLVLRRPAQAPVPVAAVPEGCQREVFEASAYVTCAFDPREVAFAMHLDDPGGKPWRRLSRLLAAEGAAPPVLAMNAGMYHEDLTPVGLFVANGVQVAPLNRAGGDGNFFMMPNGVFLVDDTGQASVMTTAAYAVAAPDVAMASQSGPMLVIDGTVNARFEPDGASRFRRNGIGVRRDGTVVLAISEGEVSFGAFGRLFRDRLAARNALYFDGVISTLSDGRRTLIGGAYPVGPILAVYRRS